MAVAPERAAVAAEAWRLLFQLFFHDGKPRFFAVAQEFDLAPMQAKLLLALGPGPGTPMREVAMLLHCDNSNVTGIVDRLETRGLVERGADPGDRRVKLIALTAKGARLHAALKARWEEPPPELTALSDTDQRALRDILRRVVEPDQA